MLRLGVLPFFFFPFFILCVFFPFFFLIYQDFPPPTRSVSILQTPKNALSIIIRQVSRKEVGRMFSFQFLETFFHKFRS